MVGFPKKSKKSSPFFKKQFSNSPRKNKQIRAREVRVIGADGKQVGILPLQDALDAAQSVGLDLVEISPNAQPPVCKIVDFGKYMYDEGKKSKSNKSASFFSICAVDKWVIRSWVLTWCNGWRTI